MGIVCSVISSYRIFCAMCSLGRYYSLGKLVFFSYSFYFCIVSCSGSMWVRVFGTILAPLCVWILHSILTLGGGKGWGVDGDLWWVMVVVMGGWNDMGTIVLVSAKI